jgi:hypothetical protein
MVLSADEPIWTDVQAFLQRARQAREAQDVAAYQSAVAHYGSPQSGNQLLPEYASEWWVVSRQEELQDTFVRLLLELARLHAAAGQVEDVEQVLRHVLAEMPTHEEAHRGLMCLFAQTARRDRALQQFAQLRDVLQRHHATDVSPQSTELYERILANRLGPQAVSQLPTPVLTAPAPDGPVPPSDGSAESRNGTAPNGVLLSDDAAILVQIPPSGNSVAATGLGHARSGVGWRQLSPLVIGAGALLLLLLIAVMASAARQAPSSEVVVHGEAPATGPQLGSEVMADHTGVVAGRGAVLLRDDLSQATVEWDIRPRELRDPRARLAGYDETELYLVKPSGSQLRSIAVHGDLVADFLAEVDARIVDAALNTYVSLDFRRQLPPEDDHYYSLQIFPNDRTYRVIHSQRTHTAVSQTPKSGVEWTALVARTGSSAINSGDARNRLAVRAAGADILVLVNGHELARVTDSSYRAGRFVLGVGGPQGSRVEGRFSNFVVHSIN